MPFSINKIITVQVDTRVHLFKEFKPALQACIAVLDENCNHFDIMFTGQDKSISNISGKAVFIFRERVLSFDRILDLLAGIVFWHIGKGICPSIVLRKLRIEVRQNQVITRIK